ncbi:MAG: serine/threonine-protein kinase [Gemmatimonadaceae bacterium]
MPSPEFIALQDALRGRFSLERELGRGGMGIVFLARDVALERSVAIKLLPPALALDRALRSRFLREAQTAARLSHPHIVPVHSVDESGALVWFVMSFIDGQSLGERIRRDGPLPIADVVRIGREAGWALAYAHRDGVVHRDVKPDNIFLERGSGRALLGDFGIARATAPSDLLRSDESVVMGTARVVSPEQGAGGEIDGRSDLYSLGVTLFVALTGQWPFDGASAAAILARHAGASAPDVRSLRPETPAILAHGVARCLRKDPADRFASADALLETLGTLGVMSATAPAVDAFVDQLKAFENESGLAASVLAVLLLQAVASSDGFQSVLFASIAGYGAFLASGVVAWRGVQIAQRARALVRRGFGVADVRRAIQQRDTVAPAAASPSAPNATKWSFWRRAAKWLGGSVALIAGSAAWWAGWHWWERDSRGLFVDGKVYAGLTLIPIALLRWGVPRLLPRDAAGRSPWARWWSGSLGRALFRWAGARDATAADEPFSPDTPTEVALASSIVSLLRTLPPGRQNELQEIEGIVARLEREAVALRAKGEALRGLPEVEARLADIAGQRRTVISAIESVRLDLLRMSSDAPSGVTKALDDADAFGRRVDRVLGEVPNADRNAHAEDEDDALGETDADLDSTPGRGTTR